MSPRSSLDKEAALGHVENLDGAPQVIEIDGFRVLGLSPDDADFYRNYSEEKRKKVMRKVSRETTRPQPSKPFPPHSLTQRSLRSTYGSYQC